MITQQKKSVRVGKYVNTEYVDTVLREYKRTRWAPNSERIGKPDSLSVWYSVEDIEDLLIKTRAHGGDGIKFYFSAYPADFAPKPEYAGRQSMVMVATKSKIMELGTVANKDIYITRNGQSTILGLNFGPICPPICNSSAEGGTGDLGITIIDRGEKGMEMI